MKEEYYKVKAELKAFIDATSEEIKSYNRFSTTPEADSQFGKRTFIRTVFSCIEAHVSHLKQSALMLCENENRTFTPEEILALKDQKSCINENGKVKIIPAKISLKANIQLSIHAFAKAIEVDYEFNFGNEEGETFLEAVRIRNRIAHPKSAKCWVISDTEERMVLSSWIWFSQHLSKVSSIIKD